jgi:hypothetical protein
MKRFVPWLLGCALLASGLGAELVSACGSSGSNTGTGMVGDGTGADDGGGAASSSGSGLTGSSSGAGSSSGSATGSSGGGTSSGSGGHGGTGSSSGGGASSSGDAGAQSAGTCLMAGSGDYSKTGPYAVSTMSVDLSDAGLSGAASPTTFTVYYPTTFEANCLHPIAAWGNGTGVTGQTTYSFFNENVASWGIVVIASDNSEVSASPYLSTGIDYLVAQNSDPSSIFYQKLSTKAGVAGHSQGGIAATTATTNSYVVSEVCVEGGGTPKSGTSVLCLTGSDWDGGLNPVNAYVVEQTYPATTGPAFLAEWDGGDHVTTPTAAGWYEANPGTIQFVRLMTAWYRCYLASDNNACALFKGAPGCEICKDPGWYEITGKNL